MKTALPILASMLVAAFAGAKDYAINELPLYGGRHDPQVEPNAEFSRDAAAHGWRYLSRGDLSTAMKRFNQAWMFDRSNPEAYWGFGIVMGRRARTEDTGKNLAESVRLLARAHELSPENGRIAGDLAFSRTLLGKHLSTQGRDGSKEYATAEKLFEEAIEREPKHAPILAHYATLKLYTGDYPAARKLLTRAQQPGYTPDPELLKALEEKERETETRDQKPDGNGQENPERARPADPR